MIISDWTDETEQKSDFKVGKYGLPEQRDIEAMLIGHLLFAPSMYETPAEKEKAWKNGLFNANKMAEAGLDGKMFETPELRDVFDHLFPRYREKRDLINVDDAGLLCLNAGQERQEAANYRLVVTECLAARSVRDAKIDLLIDAVVDRHLQKKQDAIYRRACEERSDPAIGPQKSWINMRDACVRELADPRCGIKAADLAESAGETVGWVRDMREHPEKHRGCLCGILPVDSKTRGFRPGQLTVFVGIHGGYKSTMMVNVAHGLREKGHNVLYASLEMEQKIVSLKFLCRLSGASFPRCYDGLATPEDYASLAEAQRRAAEHGKLRIMTAGNSSKIKLSQLEGWLEEHESVFRPDAVIVDYLDLVQPENATPDRPDIGIGDVCKMLRAMGNKRGFAAITAAQMKRAAWDRIRKFGIDSPEKAQLDTDDISGSHMIGGDADNVFFLFPEGFDRVKLFTAKSRYGAKSRSAGEVLRINHETGAIVTLEDDDAPLFKAMGVQPAPAAPEARQAGGDIFAEEPPSEPEAVFGCVAGNEDF
jgi:replicative DNA helicase